MPTSSRIHLDADFTLAPLDRRIFGTFVEHLGRCVYTGIFEPGHPTADANGFRGDVLELVRELGPTIVRYPGGNFLSGYNWEDGVGPRDQRPVRLDLAWGSTETNQFGTNEFIKWCRAAHCEPMLGVNLGTRGPDEARAFLEYCNHPSGTQWSDLRAQHGYPDPHGVKFWCLGNEMDGPWQICQKTAYEYGRAAKETAKVMKWVDPTIQVAACGSSARTMSTFGSWEYESLDECFEQTDFLSLHMYFENPLNDTVEFLSNADVMDRFIREAVSVCDAVAAKRRSPKRIALSFDEWNVWYKARTTADHKQPGWPKAPRLIEEIYDLQDALLVGGALITLINNADRVQAACLAQLVNVIGPIFTEPGGPAWRQTIFYPFQLTAQHANGAVLRSSVATVPLTTETAGLVPALLAAPLHDPDKKRIVVFLLNRRPAETDEVTIELRGFPPIGSCELTQICGPNLKETNSTEQPARVSPVRSEEYAVTADRITAKLPAFSWSVLTVHY
jgi:alpha-L-arabinofuranosidase